jgi:hypothetical protein
MPQDKVKEVYGLISDLGYFKDENEFKNYVSDPKKRKEAFDLISDTGYFKDENEFNSYFTDVAKPTLPPTGPQPETPQPRNKVAEMLNQPKAVDKLKQVVPTSEVTSGTKAPIMQKEQEVQQIEQKKEKKENLQLEVGYIGAKQEAVDKNIDINQLFKEKSDNLAQYLSEDSKVEYDYLKRLDDSSKQVEELTARTQATGNPLTQSELQKAKFNKFKAQQELLKYEKERSSTYDAKIKETQAELEAARLENDTELVKELEQDVVKLEAAKGKYLKNPNEKIIEVYTQAKQDMDMFKIPGTTPMERLRNYALSLNNQIEEIDNKIKRDYPGEPLEEPSYTGGYKEATRSPILEDLWKRKMELIPKMQVASQVSLLNRLPNVKEEGFFSAASRAIQKEFLPKKFTEQNIKDMPASDVGDIILQNQAISNVADAMVNQNALAATQNLSQPAEAYTPEWWGGLFGTSASIIPGFVLGNKVTSLGTLPTKLKTIKTLINVVGKSKAKTYAKFIVPTLEATKEGLRYEAAGNFLSEDLKDEANFASGFMGQMLVGPFGKAVSGKNMKALVGWFFKERAPQAAAILTSAGNKMAAGVGESIQETGEAVGPLVQEYFQTGDWGQLKTNLTKQFGDMDANMELFVGSFVMGMAMGSGTGLGDSAMNKAKDIYASMPPEQKAQAGKIVQEGFVKDLTDAEVQAKKEEIQEGAEPLAEDILTEEDKQKKQEAIEKLNNPASTVAEKVEAGTVLHNIQIKEHNANITEMALEEVAGEEVVSEEAVIETPSEETFEGVLWNEGFGNETKGDAVYLESEEASKMASDKGKAYNVKLNKPYIVSKDGDFDIIKGFIEEFKSNNPKSKWHPDTTKFVNDKLRELGYDGLVIKQEAIDTDKGYADIESTYGNAQVVAFDKKSVTPIEQPQAKEELVETPPSEVVSEEAKATPLVDKTKSVTQTITLGLKTQGDKEMESDIPYNDVRVLTDVKHKGKDGAVKESTRISGVDTNSSFYKTVKGKSGKNYIVVGVPSSDAVGRPAAATVAFEFNGEVTPEIENKLLSLDAKSYRDAQKMVFGPSLDKLQNDVADILNAKKVVSEEVITPKEEVGEVEIEKTALKDVESTAKALEGKEISTKIKTTLKEINHFTDNENFDFDKDKGVWFTTDKNGYVRRPNAKTKITRYIDEGALNLATEKQAFLAGDGDFEKGLKELQKEGYDGVKTKNNNSTEYYIFDANKTKNRQELISEAYHKAKKDGSNPELVKAVEDLLSPNEQTTPSKEQAKDVVSEEVKQETPKKEVVKEQDIETKVKELTEKRDVEIVKASKPSLKLDWVSVKDIAQLPSEISKDKKEEQAKIKTKYKELLKIMDCL